MFKTLDILACVEALHHTLQIVSSLHDIIHYLISYCKLGNKEDSFRWRRGRDAAGSHLAADWGGAEGIGTELQELQQQIDSLSDPSSLQSVSRLLQLRRQVLLLQFDTAVRIFVREAFLSSGDVTSYQSVSDNMTNALPLLSSCIRTGVFSLMLPVPRPLENQSLQKIFGYLQLCLSGLSNRSRLQANAAILGVSQLTEDVLSSSREAEPVCLHGNKDDLQHGCTPNEVRTVFKCHNSDARQLGRERTMLLHYTFRYLFQQLSNLIHSVFRGEIFYPSMRALAKQMGKEHHYEILISGSQSLLPPPGAAEVDVKAWQLHLLMESTECDMIRALQKKISRELTLVLSERTQPDNQLPTELWKRSQMKYSLSPERPQMVETFIQRLMQGAEQADGEVSRDHLQQCLAHLGSSLMERERHSFLLYSQFYEQILQQHTQLLYQKEQVHLLFLCFINPQVANLCRGMMLKISGLQAQVAHLEEEKRTLEDQFSLKFKERYNPLVQHLFSTCIQTGLDLLNICLIRGEGVDKIIKLKKTYGCTKDNDGLNLTQLKLNLENSRLTALLCKLRALRRWRQVVDQEKLHRQLLQTKQVSSRMKQYSAVSLTSYRKETQAYRVKGNSRTLVPHAGHKMFLN
uniref:Coiled-coil domain containing 162 n=1 Tax=Amphilophus citrinellus TaxID=61819 RepID=A0A3Q0RLX4_AMPCI